MATMRNYKVEAHSLRVGQEILVTHEKVSHQLTLEKIEYVEHGLYNELVLKITGRTASGEEKVIEPLSIFAAVMVLYSYQTPEKQEGKRYRSACTLRAGDVVCLGDKYATVIDTEGAKDGCVTIVSFGDHLPLTTDCESVFEVAEPTEVGEALFASFEQYVDEFAGDEHDSCVYALRKIVQNVLSLERSTNGQRS